MSVLPASVPSISTIRNPIRFLIEDVNDNLEAAQVALLREDYGAESTRELLLETYLGDAVLRLLDVSQALGIDVLSEVAYRLHARRATSDPV